MSPARALAALVVLMLTAAVPAEAENLDHMYSPATVDAISLTLPPGSWQALEEDPTGDYVEGTFSLAETAGTPDTIGAYSAPLTVGIRLKGGGSFVGLEGKAGFKLKFNEFVKKQTFLGLKKLTLNSMVQDPSMVHEVLAYEAFGAAGIAAPRTGYAWLRVNGIDFGLHLNVETMDAVALEKRFGPLTDSQHLYEGAVGADALPSGLNHFEVDEGDDEDLSDLEALIEAAGADKSETTFTQRMAPVADLDQMTRMWAVEKYLAHWDGYAALGASNNYYLLSDPGGGFQMLPWGTDQTFDHPQLRFGGNHGVLFKACLADAECRANYIAALEAADTTIAGLDLDSLAAATAARLVPWQEEEVEPRRPYSREKIEAGVAATREFIAGRPAALAKWLEEKKPPESPEEPGSEPPMKPDVTESRPSFSGRVELDRAMLWRGFLTSRVEAPDAGALTQSARAAGAGGIAACATSTRAAAAGVVVLRCRLSTAIRKKLAKRRLRLLLITSFDRGDGRPESTSRTVLLAREASLGAG